MTFEAGSTSCKHIRGRADRPERVDRHRSIGVTMVLVPSQTRYTGAGAYCASHLHLLHNGDADGALGMPTDRERVPLQLRLLVLPDAIEFRPVAAAALDALDTCTCAQGRTGRSRRAVYRSRRWP